MDRNGVLKIVRGARDVAKARGNSNTRSKATTSRQNNGRSRMRGQVGVAVRRDDNNGPLAAYDRRYDDDDHEHETAGSGEDPMAPRVGSTQQTGTQLPLDTTDYGTVDLTRDSPETTGGPRHRVADADSSSSSDGARSSQSLGAWLQPVPPPVPPAKGGNRRRKRPLQDTGRAWATTSSQRENNGMPGAGGAGADGSLAAWLEPRLPSASRERRGTPRRSGTFDAEAGRGSGGYSDSDGDDDDDSGRWMSDRLEGLDPNGAARAKDSWTDRERRNLTSTDVALGAKRKGRGGARRGWKTKADGSKVFAAPGRRGGAVASSGLAAVGLFKGGGGGDGRKKRKR